MTDRRRFSRQRLAWIILFVSFFLCLFFSVSLPLGARAFMQNAMRNLEISVQANQGTVGIDEEGGPRRAVLSGEAPQTIDPIATIRTDTTASSLVEIKAPQIDNPVARLQVSSNSSVRLNQARTPRFGGSRQPNQLEVDLESGRIRVDIPFGTARPVNLDVVTPQGLITIREPGRYILEVNDDTTQVTVQEQGKAEVIARQASLIVEPGQRAEIPVESQPLGPLEPARNLVQNGDFGQGLDNWALFSWQVELPDQPKGDTTVFTESGDPLLRFTREGVGHADVRASQSINQDVSDYETLQVQSTFRVRDQSLGVCGIQGSECPLFILINYIDDNGISRVWQQGFFTQGVVDDNLTPGACISCAVVQRAHQRVPLDQFYFFEVDLREELARQGFLPPRVIESIALVASGHSFATDISDVAIIVE